MTVRLVRRNLGFLIVLALMGGCAVGPDFKRPAPPTAKSYVKGRFEMVTAAADIAGGKAQHFVPGLDIPGQWWTLFHSPALNALVKEAIRNNPSLPAARAALRQALENVYARRGAYYPQVAVVFSKTRGRAPQSLGPVPANENLYYSLYTPQVTVSYAPDVFGGVRRSVESLKAQAEEQRFELEAAYLTLTSNVVAAAVQEASLRGQIAATEEIIRIATDQLAILRRQYALGAVAQADVAAQEAALAQAQATLPPLQKQLALQRDLITALVGRLPDAQPSQTFDLSSLKLPVELPVSLPAKLVEQRPDVRAAEAQLHAASANIGVAVAAMLPQFSLTGNAGSTALTFAELGTPGNVFWTVIGDVAQPIFSGFALLHNKRAAEAAFAQAGAQYRSTVIAACQNVADTLHALQSDADTLKAAVAAERAARSSLDIARRQLALGAVNYLALLNAQNTYQQARINLATALADRFADTAALFQALGGGWWHRKDAGSLTD